MAMFLMILSMSLLGFLVMAILFAQDRQREESRAGIRPGQKIALEPPHFFGDDVAGQAVSSQVPLEALLSQIERHVRLEQAAAESFLASPGTESLHSSATAAPVH